MRVFDYQHAPTNVPRMDIAALVTKLLLELELNEDDLARQLFVTQPTVSRWKTGSKPKAETRDRLVAYATEKGIIGNSAAWSNVLITGYIGTGGIVNTSASRPLTKKADMLPKVEKDMVSVVVEGDSMFPDYEEGSVLYFKPLVNPPTDDLIDKLCMIQLHDGRTFARRLRPGREPGTWDLLAPNASPLMGQNVAKASRIIFAALA